MAKNKENSKEDLKTVDEVPTTAIQLYERRETPLQEEQFTNRLIFSSTPESKETLLKRLPEFGQIEWLAQKINAKGVLAFRAMKRTALNNIDQRFDVFKKQYNLPKELVSFPIKCQEGTYYLSLNKRGYLCFYKHADSKGAAFKLVDEPDNVGVIKKN